MKRRYAREFDPAAPVVPLVAFAPGGVVAVKVDGKLDTGADVCTLPRSIVEQLLLQPVRVVRVSGFSGAAFEARVYSADVELSGVRFTGIDVVATDRGYALVGRNLLRRWVVRLDGPKQELSVVLGPGRQVQRRR